MRMYARIAVSLAATSVLLVAHAAAPDVEQRDVIEPVQDAPIKPVVPTLVSIIETRRLDVAENGAGQRPELMISLSLGLPRGSSIARIVQPKNLRAFDNQGNDLSKVATRHFPQQREWLSSSGLQHDAAPILNVALVTPPRDAKTISLRFDAELLVYKGIDIVDLKHASEWTVLDHPTFKAIQAEYRVTDDDKLEIRPALAQELIESAIAIDKTSEDMTEPRGRSSRSDSITVQFDLFPGMAEEEIGPVKEMKVRVWVYANASMVPVHVEIKDQKLP